MDTIDLNSEKVIRLVLINALPNCDMLLPLSHTPLIDRYFQENLFKRSFLLFMSVIACWHD